jgi:hypothetical protein
MKHVSQLHVSSAPGAQLQVSCAPATLRHESYAATTMLLPRVLDGVSLDGVSSGMMHLTTCLCTTTCPSMWHCLVLARV